MNRLNLNFQLVLRSERLQFIRDYLEVIPFKPTSDELEMMGKYILWGKEDPSEKDGPARLRNEGILLETRKGDWTDKSTESFDELLENPAFSESQIITPSHTPLKSTKHTYTRTQMRRLTPPHLLTDLESLWTQIDELEYKLNLYELSVHKRTQPPRAELTNRIKPAARTALELEAVSLSPYSYLRLKHYLVELRQQQYNFFGDEPLLTFPTEDLPLPIEAPQFGTEIEVKPLGIPLQLNSLHYRLFSTEEFPFPAQFTPEELKAISSILWRPPIQNPIYTFDFTQVSHLNKLIGILRDLEDAAAEAPTSTLPLFLHVFRSYRSLSRLSPILEDIIELKAAHRTNLCIRDYIGEKYKKFYNPNYISTLYNKGLGLIAETAAYHREVCENLVFPENFKKCSCCGRTLLIDRRNFKRKSVSTDGFAARCKLCDKQKKENIE